jgi:uncharacterized protein
VHDDPERFLAEAGPLLLADEARHNLAFGITATARDSPDVYPERRFWTIHAEGRVVAAALRTPPHGLVLARPESDAALAALVEAIDDDLPGLVGAVPEVHSFAERWSEKTGRAAQIERRQGVYALHEVQPVPAPSGAVREATATDRDLLAAWLHAFAREALGGTQADEAAAQRGADHRLSSANAGALLWEDDGSIVSLAGWGGPTPNGIRVGPVYTPPGLRGRGYATALVAELSRRLLAAGRRFCFLYTDLANPTANAIYVRIGYEQVCESAEIRFG